MCYVITHTTIKFPILDELENWQVEALKPKNVKKEGIAHYADILHDDPRGLKVFKNWLWVPKVGGLRQKILDEAHKSKLSIHPGTSKMYYDVRADYWWPGLKRDIGRYVQEWLVCLQVKEEHQKPYKTPEILNVPVWKMEEFSLDFITKLAKTARQHDNIWVIVDCVT